MAYHGMGGNVGDAVAPLVIGFLLQSYNWRTVVLINVVPGIAVACFILVYVGRLQMAEVRAGLAKFKPAALSGTQRLRMVVALLRNRALVTLVIGSAFRSMTQGALLTFLPLYLSRVMGYSPLWIGGCMFALQAAGFVAAPIAGHLSDMVGRRQIIMSSMSMTAVVILFMIFAGGTGWFVFPVAILGFFLFAVEPCSRPGCWMPHRPAWAAALLECCLVDRLLDRRSDRSALASWPIILASCPHSISSPARSSLPI